MISTNKDIGQEVVNKGYAFLPASSISIPDTLNDSYAQLEKAWESLSVDEYLDGSSQFRYRRHGRFSYQTQSRVLRALEHDYYYQPDSINSYAGGVKRLFAPLLQPVIENSFLQQLLLFNFSCLPLAQESDETWVADIHFVRIVARDSERGSPTPEGIHHDGFKYLSFHLINRTNVTGGVSEVYSPQKEIVDSRLLQTPMDCWFADDDQVMHATTPVELSAGEVGWRDMLLLSYHKRD